MVRFRHRLSFRQARDAVVVAFVLGLIFSLFQIVADLNSEREAVDRTVNQVSTTAPDSSGAVFICHHLVDLFDLLTC